MPGPAWGTGQDAAAPPPSASAMEFETSPSGSHFVQPQPFNTSSPTSGQAASGAVPGGALEDEKDSCVICMAAPVQAGFLHGSRYDKLLTLRPLYRTFIQSFSSPPRAFVLLWVTQGSESGHAKLQLCAICSLHER